MSWPPLQQRHPTGMNCDMALMSASVGLGVGCV